MKKQMFTKTQTTSMQAIWIALIAVYLAWGATYLAIRFAVETMPPFLMAAVRFLIAGAALYALRRAVGDAKPSAPEWRSAAIIGTFLLAGGNGGVVWAEQWVASGVAALLVSTVPLWMVLFDSFYPHGRKHGLREIVGVLIGFGGVILLIGPVRISGETEVVNPAGAAALLLAAVLWSIGSLYNRGARLPSSPLLGIAMEMLAGGGGLLILSLLTGEWDRLDINKISAVSLWGLAYLIVFGSWIGFAAYVWLLRVAPTPLVSTYAYVNPVVAIFLGHLLAQEPLTPRILMATAIIMGAVALTAATRFTPSTIHTQPMALRSPREVLGGYIILPRLIDKVRLHAQGKLPPEYVEHLLKPGLTLDGRFLTFSGLDGEALRRAIVSAQTDAEVMAWVKPHARPHAEDDKRRWGEDIDAYRPDPERAERRKQVYRELGSRIDVAAVSVLDLIDMDEGRIPMQSTKE